MIKFGIIGCGGFMERGTLPMMQNVDNAKVVAAVSMYGIIGTWGFQMGVCCDVLVRNTSGEIWVMRGIAQLLRNLPMVGMRGVKSRASCRATLFMVTSLRS